MSAVTDAMLPPGVHPTDRRSAQSGPGGDVPYTDAPAPQRTQGRQPFATPNGRALPVNQRASQTWTGRAVGVTSEPTRVVGRRRGRRGVLLWVPKKVVAGGTLHTVTEGVLIAPSAGEASQHAGLVLDPTDEPVFLETEGSVYVISLPTASGTTWVQFLDLFNAAAQAPAT